MQFSGGAPRLPGIKIYQGMMNPTVPQKRPTQFDRPLNARTTIGRVSGVWPTVQIAPIAHGKMWALVQQCDIEVGWLCACRQLENGDFVIDDIFVPKQVCTIATTDITRDGEAELLAELMQANRLDVVKTLCCWGHSHVDMEVFASSVDEKQTESFLRRHMKRKSKFFLRVIANQKGDFFCSVYLLDIGVSVHNPRLQAERPKIVAWRDWAKEQIKIKVERRVFTSTQYSENLNDFDFDKTDRVQLKRWLSTGGIDFALYRQLARRSAHPKNAVITKKGGLR